MDSYNNNAESCVSWLIGVQKFIMSSGTKYFEDNVSIFIRPSIINHQNLEYVFRKYIITFSLIFTGKGILCLLVTVHACWLQCFSSQFLPLQFRPGCLGFGFVHVRYLCISPLSHVFEHEDHPSHKDHIPSTPNTSTGEII